MFCRVLPAGLVLLGTALVGLAASDYLGYAPLGMFQARDTEPFLEVGPTEFDFAGANPGEEKKITVILNNLSSRAVQVLGMGEC